jgi:hypothetical protein
MEYRRAEILPLIKIIYLVVGGLNELQPRGLSPSHEINNYITHNAYYHSYWSFVYISKSIVISPFPCVSVSR